jgi:hypothetical protein
LTKSLAELYVIKVLRDAGLKNSNWSSTDVHQSCIDTNRIICKGPSLNAKEELVSQVTAEIVEVEPVLEKVMAEEYAKELVRMSQLLSSALSNPMTASQHILRGNQILDSERSGVS